MGLGETIRSYPYLISLQEAQKHEDAVWAEPVAPESRLFFAPNSLLHTSPHIRPVIDTLTQARILPDSLIPGDYREHFQPFVKLHWNAKTDPYFNFVEEYVDFLYQILKWAISGTEISQQLMQARVSHKPKDQEGIITEWLTKKYQVDWVIEAIGHKHIPDLVKLYIEAMDSRSSRNVRLIQTSETIWKKMFGNTGHGERMSEYHELLQSAYAVEMVHSKADIVNGVYTLHQIMNAMPHQFPQEENEFLLNMDKVMENYLSIIGQTGLKREDIMKILFQKQQIRFQIGKLGRGKYAHFPGLDLRALPKVITQLFLPYLVSDAADKFVKTTATPVNSNFDSD